MRIEQIVRVRSTLLFLFALAIAITMSFVVVRHLSLSLGLPPSASSQQPAINSPTIGEADPGFTDVEYRILLDGWREGNLLREIERNRQQTTEVASASSPLQLPAATSTNEVEESGGSEPLEEQRVPALLGLVIPNVKGLTYVQAVEMLRSLGLSIVRHEETNPAVASETILRQTPTPGEEVSPHGVIELVVSLGNRVRLPNVYGLRESEALRLLTAAGLKVPTWGINPQGRNTDIPESVLRQVCIGCILSVRPSVFSLVPIGSDVFLAVRSE